MLGLGAVATLATWSDDEWVVSSFTTSPFEIEARVNLDSGWEPLDTPPGGELEFHIASDGLLPGESVYAHLELRVKTGESDARVWLPAAPTVGTLTGNDATFFNTLRLTLYKDPPGGCSAVGTAGHSPIFGFDGTGGLSTTSNTLVELPGNGNEVGICYKVTLPADAGPGVAGGSTGPLVWNLRAEPI